MELWRLVLEKLAFYVMGIAPGAVAIYVYYLANPRPIHLFLTPNQLGYGTKIAVGIAACFVIGNTLTALLGSLVGAIAGAAFGAMGHKDSNWPDVPKIAPWRDPQWRRLATSYLQQHAPSDTIPISENEFQTRMKSIGLLPEQEQSRARSELAQVRMQYATDDTEWSRWYSQIANQQKEDRPPDISDQFGQGFAMNLQAAALYLLISMFFVPAIRNWVAVLFAVVWCLRLIADIYGSVKRAIDPWTTLSDQIAFLSRVTLAPSTTEEASINLEDPD